MQFLRNSFDNTFKLLREPDRPECIALITTWIRYIIITLIITLVKAQASVNSK